MPLGVGSIATTDRLWKEMVIGQQWNGSTLCDSRSGNRGGARKARFPRLLPAVPLRRESSRTCRQKARQWVCRGWLRKRGRFIAAAGGGRAHSGKSSMRCGYPKEPRCRFVTIRLFGVRFEDSEEVSAAYCARRIGPRRNVR